MMERGTAVINADSTYESRITPTSELMYIT